VKGPDVGRRKEKAPDFQRPNAGDDIFGGDRVRTGDSSLMQLKLCDWSTYTFSPNSESNINEFYSADGAQQRRVVNYVRGGLRMLSGKDSKPGATEVEFEEAGVTMGVRGTGVVVVQLDGLIYVLLEGPGLDNTGLANPGAVDFTDDEKNEILAKLTRAGFAVTIGPDGVSEPFMPDAETLRRIYAAFTPVFTSDDDTDTTGGSNPLNDSDQDDHEADDNIPDINDYNDREDEDPDVEPDDRPTFIVGDIVTLPELEAFAGGSADPDGHVLALATVHFEEQSISGGSQTHDGVALLQVHFDFSSRTIAPEAFGSFVVLDPNSANPDDLTQDEFFGSFGGPATRDAFIQQLLSGIQIPFADGEGGLAVYETDLFTFTVRHGVGGTITLDVDVHFEGPDEEGTTQLADAIFTDLEFLPGAGDLAFWEGLGDAPIAGIMSIDELDESCCGEGYLSGFSLAGEPDEIAENPFGFPLGVAYGQLRVDFDGRTVGGGESFVVMTEDGSTAFLPLGQVSFDDGLFNLGFFPLILMADSETLVKGQALINNFEGLFGDLAAILAAEDDKHLYSEIILFTDEGLRPELLPVDELEDLANSFESSVANYDGLFAGSGMMQNETGFFEGSASASIQVNFGDRTIGGGQSHIGVFLENFSTSSTFDLVEFMETVSFDEGFDGLGVFGLDAGDFNDSPFIESVLLLLRRGEGDPVSSGDLFFTFNDGGEGKGTGEIDNMPLVDGPASCPCD
jgi:hypothetical protein